MSQAEINLLTVFRRIAEALDALPIEELRRLSDPNCIVEIRTVRRRPKDEPSLFPAGASVDSVIDEISKLATRQEAQALLDSRYPTKKILELIGRKLDIPIVKQDKAETLRDKIIEATVGARIRSQAIQGTST